MNMIAPRQDWKEQSSSDLIARDCENLNFWQIDRSIRDLLELYLAPEAFAHFAPHLDRLGALGGGLLNELAMTADKLFGANLRFCGKLGYEIEREAPFKGGTMVHFRKPLR